MTEIIDYAIDYAKSRRPEMAVSAKLYEDGKELGIYGSINGEGHAVRVVFDAPGDLHFGSNEDAVEYAVEGLMEHFDEREAQKQLRERFFAASEQIAKDNESAAKKPDASRRRAINLKLKKAFSAYADCPIDAVREYAEAAYPDIDWFVTTFDFGRTICVKGTFEKQTVASKLELYLEYDYIDFIKELPDKVAGLLRGSQEEHDNRT